MDWVIVAGVAALGGIVGRIGWETFVRQPQFGAKAASAIVSLMVGPIVAGIFQIMAGTKSALPREVWFYPVGLLLGAIAYGVQDFSRRRREETRQELEKEREKERQERENEREKKRQERENEREKERQEHEKAREKERQEFEKDRNLIYNYIRNKINESTRKKDFEMMSFGTLRDDLQKPEWDDNFFGKIIRECPHVFTYATVDYNRSGIKIIGPLNLICPHCGRKVI